MQVIWIEARQSRGRERRRWGRVREDEIKFEKGDRWNGRGNKKGKDKKNE